MKSITDKARRLLLIALTTITSAAGACTAPDPRKANIDALNSARAELAASSYETEIGATACDKDCSEHDAGYRWAAKNGIAAADQCGGTNQSFIDGCKAFNALLQKSTSATDAK